MPESSKDNPQERKADDLQYMLDVAKQIKADDIDIKQIIRLGKKSDEPRLTKVVLQTVSQTRSLLQNSKALKDSGKEEEQKIYITPDLSAKTRKEEKELRQEISRRR